MTLPLNSLLFLFIGAIFKGHFQQDKKHGRGIKSLPNGHTSQEIWESGVLIDETMHDEIQMVFPKKDRPENNSFRADFIPKDGRIPA